MMVGVVGFAAAIYMAVVFTLWHFSRVVAFGDADVEGMMRTALLAAAVGLAVLSVLCWYIIDSHLGPLTLLANSAEHIAARAMNSSSAEEKQGGKKGEKADEMLPFSHRRDEIGQLQNSFATMQHSLADYISEIQTKRDTLVRQNEEMEQVYEQARRADDVKTRFLNQMTEQMAQNVEAITALNDTLCEQSQELSKAELMKMKIQMLAYTDNVTRLLDQMLNKSSSTQIP